MGKAMKMCPVHLISFILVIIGALNWGLVGLIQFNLVEFLLRPWSLLQRIVYVLVGIAAILLLTKGKCRQCRGEGKITRTEAAPPAREEPGSTPGQPA